jgi:ribosome-binding factor A
LVSKTRIQRIADRIREELSEMMLQEVQDPRLEGISITDVTVDRELAFAEVYVSAIEGSERADEVLQGLWHAGGYLRSNWLNELNCVPFHGCVSIGIQPQSALSISSCCSTL